MQLRLRSGMLLFSPSLCGEMFEEVSMQTHISKEFNGNRWPVVDIHPLLMKRVQSLSVALLSRLC